MGEVLKLYDFDDKGQMQLNTTSLERVLSATNGLPIVVLSVAGDFRGGKSFLLNIIMLCLLQNGRDGWLNDRSLIKGFPSKKSDKTVTTGIDVWSEPFIMKNIQGESIAFILLDTQGMHDNEASKSQFTRIFALSTLLSDFQIYNIRNDIGSDKLEQLNYFLEFAKYAEPSDSSWKVLVMLVRDWQNSDNYGFSEGDVHLKETLTSTSVKRDLQTSLHKFIKVKCCLLPHPGLKMTKKQEFQGPIYDLEKDFREEVVDFVAKLLIENQAEGKTSVDLRDWCHKLADRFKSADLPCQETIIVTEAKTMCKKAHKAALNLFQLKVEDALKIHSNQCMIHEKLEEVCSDAKAKALASYDEKRTGFEVQEIREAYRAKLNKKLDTEMNRYFVDNRRRLQDEKRRKQRESELQNPQNRGQAKPLDHVRELASDLTKSVTSQALQYGLGVAVRAVTSWFMPDAELPSSSETNISEDQSHQTSETMNVARSSAFIQPSIGLHMTPMTHYERVVTQLAFERYLRK